VTVEEVSIDPKSTGCVSVWTEQRPHAQLQAIFRPFKEDPLTVKVFSVLQIVSGSFLAFSHGSNDTA
jgi:phosphate/sulfate permease